MLPLSRCLARQLRAGNSVHIRCALIRLGLGSRQGTGADYLSAQPLISLANVNHFRFSNLIFYQNTMESRPLLANKVKGVSKCSRTYMDVRRLYVLTSAESRLSAMSARCIIGSWLTVR